jgi:hypothetical protein
MITIQRTWTGTPTVRRPDSPAGRSGVTVTAHRRLSSSSLDPQHDVVGKEIACGHGSDRGYGPEVALSFPGGGLAQ